MMIGGLPQRPGQGQQRRMPAAHLGTAAAGQKTQHTHLSHTQGVQTGAQAGAPPTISFPQNNQGI